MLGSQEPEEKLAIAFPTAIHSAWKSHTTRFPHSHSADGFYVSEGDILTEAKRGTF